MQQLPRESRVMDPISPQEGSQPHPKHLDYIQGDGPAGLGQQQLRDRTQLFHTDLNHSWPDLIQLPSPNIHFYSDDLWRGKVFSNSYQI